MLASSRCLQTHLLNERDKNWELSSAKQTKLEDVKFRTPAGSTAHPQWNPVSQAWDKGAAT